MYTIYRTVWLCILSRASAKIRNRMETIWKSQGKRQNCAISMKALTCQRNRRKPAVFHNPFRFMKYHRYCVEYFPFIPPPMRATLTWGLEECQGKCHKIVIFQFVSFSNSCFTYLALAKILSLE